ncbi:MAG TPA: DUF4142 domain-containing protein [Pirellulales bacterium]|nr:DUF4142 domain-containing protein [Pirellulales bacterium]
MRKWIVSIAAASVLISACSVASAQLRRSRRYSQTYEPAYQNQYAQPQYQQYQQGPYQQEQYRQGAYQQGPYQQGPYQQGQPRMANRSYTQGAVDQRQGASLTDQQVANWLLVDDRGEIQLARLAEERASSDEVKDFAKQLIDDHARTVEQLQRFTGMGRPGPQDYAANRGLQPAGGLNIIRLKQQLGQQCVASAQHELEEKEGEEFDKCYIGMQLGMHHEMLTSLKVFSRYASPQLDQVIEESEHIAQEHLDRAKELMKQLEKEGSDSGDSKDRS